MSTMDWLDKIETILHEKVASDAVTGQLKDCTPSGFLVKSEAIDEICQLLFEHPETYFDMLSCLTGIDNSPESEKLEVVYNLYSIGFGRSLTLKTEILKSKPSLPTVSHIWRTADWHEREAFDLLGIEFKGHKDLRRILMPADWIGHPLRKDYLEPDQYHGMKTTREEDPPVT